MSIYSIEFKPLSVLTKIPDAQTIFGAFCYKYKEIFGNDKLNEFLEKENSDNHVVLFSSMFYKNVLPLPHDFTLKHQVGLSLEETINNKRTKKIKFVSKQVYLDFINNKEEFESTFRENIDKKYKIINKEILAFQNEDFLDEKYLVNDFRIRNAYSLDEDKKLFRDEVMYCNDKLTFNIYVNILDDSFKDNVIKTFESMQRVFFGGLKSIGYNLYSFVSTKEETEISLKRHNMLLSKSIIDKNIDLENSYYTPQFISNKFNTQSNKLYRKQLLVLNEGSVISTSKDVVGGLIKEEQNGNVTYQYYLGMII